MQIETYFKLNSINEPFKYLPLIIIIVLKSPIDEYVSTTCYYFSGDDLNMYKTADRYLAPVKILGWGSGGNH